MQNAGTGKTNRWKTFHKSLEAGIADKYQDKIKRVLHISQTAFYRKLNNPRKLSTAEKAVISGIYNLKQHYFFPEPKNNREATSEEP